MAREGPRRSVRPGFGRLCAPSHAIPHSDHGPAFELRVVTDREGDKQHYVVIVDNLTHGLNERINYSE
jgi:hypothetical protein